LRHGAGQLGGGFNQQHAGKKRFTGEMPAQKRFITAHGVLPCAAPPRVQSEQLIDKPELRSVR